MIALHSFLHEWLHMHWLMQSEWHRLQLNIMCNYIVLVFEVECNGNDKWQSKCNAFLLASMVVIALVD